MRGRTEALCLLLALALLAAPAVFWEGGVLDVEAIDFFGRYWSERPAAEKIFDVGGSDEFQSRELSYALDWLDALGVKGLLGAGRAFFVPASAVAAALLTVAAWAWGAPRAWPGLDRPTAGLLLSVYLSNFAVLSTSGVCYRATKPVVAPLLLFVLLFVVSEHRTPRAGRRAGFAVVAGVGLLMSLLDRQGFLDLVALTAALVLAWLVRRQGLHLALGAVAATAMAQAYNSVVGPWLIVHLTEYSPNLRFQRVHLRRLLDPGPWLSGLSLLRDWAAVLLGSLPAGFLVAGCVGGALLALGWAWRVRAGRGILAPAVVLVAAASQMGMTAVMVQRHEPVTWIDHRVWYYPIPFQALLLFGLAWALEGWALARGGALPGGARLVVLAFIASNVAHWPELRQRMESGPWFADVSRGSAALKRSLRAGTPDPLLDDGYRHFFFDCLERFPRLAARAGPYVREADDVEDPVFRDGRLFAWARKEAHLTAFAPTAGVYLLQGGFRLRPGDAVLVLLGGATPRPLAEVRRAGDADGSEFLSVPVELPRGPSDIVLRSRLPERSTGESLRGSRLPRHAAFGVLLPFLLRPGVSILG